MSEISFIFPVALPNYIYVLGLNSDRSVEDMCSVAFGEWSEYHSQVHKIPKYHPIKARMPGFDIKPTATPAASPLLRSMR